MGFCISRGLEFLIYLHVEFLILFASTIRDAQT